MSVTPLQSVGAIYLQDAKRANPRVHAVIGTVIGNSLELFDFAAYAFLAAVIGRHFFPAGNDTLSLMSSFAVFGVGYIARPLGAVFFGRLGDVRGRKLALVIALPLMSIGTLIVGLTPSYASIGIAAPILLIVGRLLQGFSAGGEMGNAVAFLLEWAPPQRRGLYSSLQQCSGIFGTVLGSACAALLTNSLSAQDMEAWGWRVPFLIGGLVIAPLGLFLRHKVEETPVYADAPQHASSKPVGPAWLQGAKTIGLMCAWIVAFYVFLIYLPSFLEKQAGVSEAHALWASTTGLLAMMVSTPLSGLLSDYVGRRPVLLVAALVTVVAPYPAFRFLLSAGGYLPKIFLTAAAAGVFVGMFAGVGPAVMSEMFPTSQRTTGISVSFGLATAILGGFAPFLSTWLIEVTGSPLSPTFYVIAAAAVTSVMAFRMRETAFERLH